MSQPQPHAPRFTYADYITWPDEERWEIIEGVPYDMTPAPAPTHQAICAGITAELYYQLKGKPCTVYPAPFDVRLPDKDESADNSSTVVQPDVSVVCDARKIDSRGCVGAPDFLVEILSPYTAKKDHLRKLALYEKHGVREYWIVQPTDAIIIIRLLGEDGRYAPPEFRDGRGRIPVSVLDGISIDFDPIFPPPPPPNPSPREYAQQ